MLRNPEWIARNIYGLTGAREIRNKVRSLAKHAKAGHLAVSKQGRVKYYEDKDPFFQVQHLEPEAKSARRLAKGNPFTNMRTGQRVWM